METITSEEMAVVDRNCDYYGLSTLQLMEAAGKGLADEILKRFDSGKLCIFAGLGNNGGDAFVAARYLKNFNIDILLMDKANNIRTEIAKRNFKILKFSGYKIVEITDSTMLDELELDCDIIIDGMLGTGVRGKLRQPYTKAVEKINSSKAYVVSVDVPTGLNPDNGEYIEAVKADLTVTFHKAKPGLLKAKEVVGELVVKDIGISDLLEKLAGPGDVIKAYKRFKDAHKGMHGRILIVGNEYTGAPTLAALAAYYTGVDIVTLAVPESIKDVVASFSPNLIVKALKGNRLSLENLDTIVELAKQHHVFVMGMGAGKHKEVVELTNEILKSVNKAVLDAEVLTKDIEIPENCECILTPHKGEFKRLFGVDADVESVKTAAKEINATILLKSSEDIISDGARVRINRSGNVGMTVGGTGDVLAGVVAAFFSLNDAFWSASAAAFVNGRAGDLCFEELGYNYTATDVIKKIPIVIKSCL
ncbi:bifunctional ADP-dependent NAD(P)H-hydrate dehydratase/NAD(P)H-hydrate epimerase [Archaeoglobales archaeon]|nr:MAG: bifunctional ADP-dependent NAD(P)H-hydrate dehydratase/NAD(P)H-hydrate epimerase [Archaeoglobales archaeon]